MSTLPVHSRAFRTRRFLNWAPLGLTYAFLYMGRYNLTVAKSALGDLMSLEQFGIIFGIGTITYGLSFLLNGPLTDRMGGRRAILVAAIGSGLMNGLLGWFVRDYILSGAKESPTAMISALYAANMYFQSFGAVAIVKVNSNWFHVHERGTFSAIFGAIISSGIFLAFDVGYRIVGATAGTGPGGVDATWWVFFVPSVALFAFAMIDFGLVKDLPSDAGLADFDTGAARLSDDDKPLPTLEILKRIVTNPIILTVAAIEFCSGVLRNGIMHWYPLYAKSELVLNGGHFMMQNWGLVLFVAGVTGGTFAGLVSDKVFQSRRGPAAGGLYFGMVIACIVMIFSLGGTEPQVGWIKGEVEIEGQEERVPLTTLTELRSGDLILAVDGEEITTRAGLVAILDTDGTYPVVVLRGGQRVDISVVVGDDNRKALRFRKNLVTLKDFEVAGTARTVIHWQGNWAYEAGLRQGDVITAVNDEAPSDWGDVQDLLKTDGSVNSFSVQRGEENLELPVIYPAYAPQTPEFRAKYMKVGPVQTLNPYVLGAIAFFISLCVIGSHGLLSGTATMDFGGKRGTATAVGVIDGFVYLGTGLQAFALGYLTSNDWSYWPWFLLPFAIIGFIFCLRIWNVKPRSGGGGH